MTAEDDDRTVALSVPAHPDYLALARLALGAVCRLTPLEPEDVADLKLAVTEAASGALLDEPAAAGNGAVDFNFRLEDDRLVLEVRGATRPAFSVEEREMARAIIDATVDAFERDGASIRLVKQLEASNAFDAG